MLWVLGLLLAFAEPARAWGVAGHRIVARMAAAKITDPAVRAGILAALDGDTNSDCKQGGLAERLACVSTWADDIKRTTMRFTSNWHFVDIPKNQTSYDQARDCRPTPRGDCIILAIERQRALLVDADPATTPQVRAEALKFIVHLAGDLTQPLHCVTDHDNGGNGKVTTWFGEAQSQYGHWNLHSVWDDGLILRSLTPKEEMAKSNTSLDVAYAKLLLAREAVPASGPFSGDLLIAWALEGHDAGVKKTYATLPEPRQGSLDGPENTPKMFYPLGAEYLEQNISTVELQLQRAGQRLADLLNELFAAPPAR